MSAATQTQYRLSWESPDSWLVAGIEERHGRDVWPRYDWNLLGDWHRTEVVFTGDERMGQYHTLKRWADTREQPIRNVRLERREVALDNEGWAVADV